MDRECGLLAGQRAVQIATRLQDIAKRGMRQGEIALPEGVVGILRAEFFGNGAELSIIFFRLSQVALVVGDVALVREHRAALPQHVGRLPFPGEGIVILPDVFIDVFE